MYYYNEFIYICRPMYYFHTPNCVCRPINNSISLNRILKREDINEAVIKPLFPGQKKKTQKVI